MTATTERQQRRSARERQRAWRARLRDGVAIYPVQAGHLVLDLLIDLGWLREDESADRREVGKAIGALLDDTAQRHRKIP